MVQFGKLWQTLVTIRTQNQKFLGFLIVCALFMWTLCNAFTAHHVANLGKTTLFVVGVWRS
jgi:hypothetical protein